ncbi:MAG: class II fructose-bisphosphate aldolase [Candidatus ainarchaeum sp.]|nr:class II fructose-bisphosphate aldolase [Candidatus ainarchaeum sp.]
MLVSLNSLLHKALEKKFAVPAFNVNSMEMVQAVFSAAEKSKSPVIIGITPSALEYSSDLLPSIVFARARFSKIPFALHLDHGRNFSDCKKAVSLGFSSVMIDASINYEKKDFSGKHPARDFSENSAITKKVVEFARSKGISVEGEIGTLGGIEDSASASAHLTSPEEAKQFAEETGIDALAIAIGTSHGAYKFKGNPSLKLEIVKQTRKLLPKMPLVLHGASSVPKETVEQCRKFCLNIGAEAQGVPILQIKKAISFGICKINIDTDARLAFMGAMLQKVHDYNGAIDLREYFGEGRSAIEKIFVQKMKDFGSTGKL